MMAIRVWLLWITVALGSFMLPGPGQGQAPSVAAGGREASDVGKSPVAPPFPVHAPYPFRVGETLTYEFSFSRFPLSGKLGELELSVVSLDTAQALTNALATKLKRDLPRPDDSQPAEEACPSALPSPGLAFQARARTRGFLPALLRVDVRHEYLSVVDATDLGLTYNQRDLRNNQQQKFQMTCQARARETRAVLEWAGQDGAVNLRTLPGRGWTTDLQTFWYVLRTQPLTPGSVIPMVLTEDERVYDLPVVVTGEVEVIKTRAGRFRTRKLDLKVRESGFVRYEGSFLLWLSEDAARLPVRVRFKARGVTVTGELTRYTTPR
ncbi:DUF3108 domain-containing protein [Chloracidobacterium validum]|uniref:DUF3108 domain-containing protein n=1 Tax=Chloracidobacterium validum TaxID=2821543 RepID=A0ABX8BGK4_9BACT|nr:DUF3108 domain-containing protein [Chloracidobacterium validum]QUW04215.1 DUF3108 domain-containing protein [Chloracidobacterium validum]